MIIQYYKHADETDKLGMDPMDFSDFKDLWRGKKVFEKAALQHIDTRNKIKTFLYALILPDRDFPTWYLKCYDNSTNQNSRLKTLMPKIAATSPQHYNALVSPLSRPKIGIDHL